MIEQGYASGVSKSGAFDRLAATFSLFCVCAFVYFWFWAWKTPVWLQDDLLFATRSGFSHGETSLTALWDGLQLDLFTRNSRSADFFAQAVFASGVWLPYFMFASFVVFSASLTWFLISALKPGGDGLSVLALFTIAGFAIPLTYTFFDTTAMATYLFMSATVGYIWGGTWFFCVASLLCRGLVKQRPLSRLQVIVTVLLATLVAFHHEVLALMQLVLALVTAVYLWWRQALRPSALVLGWVAAVSVLRFFTPGMWKRTEIYTWPFLTENMGFISENQSRLTYFLTYFLSHNRLIILLAVAAFTCFYLVYVKRGWLPRWMVLTHLCSVILLGGSVFLSMRLTKVMFTPETLSFTQYQAIIQSKSGIFLLVTALMALFLQIINLLVALLQYDQVGIPVTFALTLTGFLVPVKLSFLNSRPLFFGLFFLLLAATQAGIYGATAYRGSLRNPLILAIMLSAVGLSGWQIVKYTQPIAANQDAWLQVVAQVEACQAGGVVEFPAKFPAPLVHSAFGDEGQQYLQHLRDYYALPTSCQLRIAK